MFAAAKNADVFWPYLMFSAACRAMVSSECRRGVSRLTIWSNFTTSAACKALPVVISSAVRDVLGGGGGAGDGAGAAAAWAAADSALSDASAVGAVASAEYPAW